MQVFKAVTVILALSSGALLSRAQQPEGSGVPVVPATKGAIKQAIEAKYTLAEASPDRKDVTAAGAVIDMLKDNLALSSTAQIGTDPTEIPRGCSSPANCRNNQG